MGNRHASCRAPCASSMAERMLSSATTFPLLAATKEEGVINMSPVLYLLHAYQKTPYIINDIPYTCCILPSPYLTITFVTNLNFTLNQAKPFVQCRVRNVTRLRQPCQHHTMEARANVARDFRYPLNLHSHINSLHVDRHSPECRRPSRAGDSDLD